MSPGRAARVGIVGCGYVFDRYMATWGRHPTLELAGVVDIDHARVARVTSAYGIRSYDSLDELLRDQSVDIVVNLTSIDSHYGVTKAALRAGKHVYSEKPLCPDLDQATELVEVARDAGLGLSCAPSNALSDSTQTMWKAVLDGAIGNPKIVYAEMDDNPIYLMSPEEWRSPTGAPWPYTHEYEQGCTYEHAGYQLTQLCAILGPVESVTGFSKCTIPEKTSVPLSPPDTPDFSVGCLHFRSGVVGRLTCSIGAPYDHRVRIIGDRGMLAVDTYRDDRTPVYHEPFSKLSLNARKARSVRRSPILQGIFGVGGRRLRLVQNPPPGQEHVFNRAGSERQGATGLIARWKRRELGLQDKTLGIAEFAVALRDGRPFFPSPSFTLHLTELTIAIQNAGLAGAPHIMQTTFDPIVPRRETLLGASDYGNGGGSGRARRAIDTLLDRMHRQ